MTRHSYKWGRRKREISFIQKLARKWSRTSCCRSCNSWRSGPFQSFRCWSFYSGRCRSFESFRGGSFYSRRSRAFRSFRRWSFYSGWRRSFESLRGGSFYSGRRWTFQAFGRRSFYSRRCRSFWGFVTLLKTNAVTAGLVSSVVAIDIKDWKQSKF